MTGYNFSKRSAQRIGRAVRSYEQQSRTNPATRRKDRRIPYTVCDDVRMMFVPSPDDYTPDTDVEYVVPAWVVEEVDGTPTVTSCTYQEVKACPAAVSVPTVFVSEQEMLQQYPDVSEVPAGTVLTVTNDPDTDNRVNNLYVGVGEVGGDSTELLAIGVTNADKRRWQLWATVMR